MRGKGQDAWFKKDGVWIPDHPSYKLLVVMTEKGKKIKMCLGWLP